ncbi:conserved hypothetical protein [Culex quinquefasciatus]|uniref:Ionotropic glutamate receptor C-terminal domain-containing protein n=1 Tax=Culex quinquefasciatus TaxID=7176 RepID=B0WMG8_CULQU|nr:conserved hypothetical protein [Culex quinquefasciatus]|eukprot:XP_001849902.1 conserved hypothetical protein [Culex quinquefasciatus]
MHGKVLKFFQMKANLGREHSSFALLYFLLCHHPSIHPFNDEDDRDDVCSIYLCMLMCELCSEQTTLYISLISSDGEDMVAIASTLLRITPFPTVIITVPKAVRELSHSRSVCVVLLNDPWPYLGFEMWDRTLTRTIVVTNLANMRTVANAFSGRQQIPRVIYLIYDDPETPFRYYQPYNRTFHYLRRIDSNPFDAAEQDLHGMLVSANLSASIDQYLLETVLDRVNATFTTDLDYTHLMVPDLIEEFLEGFNDHINYVDMQRSNYYVLLVPKSKRKPLFSVLYDPFDWFTWISFGGIVVLLGAILVLLSTNVSLANFSIQVKNLLSNALEGSPVHSERALGHLLIGCFMIGSLILVSCYQSLVISFLLSNRYYPELDTDELIYESCCFVEGIEKVAYNDLFRYRMCNITEVLDMDTIPDNSDFAELSAAHGLCSSMPHTVVITIEIPSCYRISKLTTHIFPQLAVVRYESPLYEQICKYSLEFATGGLINHYEATHTNFTTKTAANTLSDSTNSIKTEDLKLVWITYPIGITISLITFAAEFLPTTFVKIFPKEA